MKYKVNGYLTVSCWTEVEANSEQEALQIALGRELASHHIDGSFLVDECWHFDNDGSPENISIETN